MDADTIMNRLDKVTQSDESLEMDESMTFTIGIQKKDRVAGCFYFTDLHTEKAINDLLKRQCIIDIKNNDQLCLSRSLAVVLS